RGLRDIAGDSLAVGQVSLSADLSALGSTDKKRLSPEWHRRRNFCGPKASLPKMNVVVAH
ncbi:MAG: hypothetical protein AAFP90_19240, partial [Planctomycetota bacterium]